MDYTRNIIQQYIVRRQIVENINWERLFIETSDLLYYSRVLRVQPTFNPRSVFTNRHIIEEALEAAQDHFIVYAGVEDPNIEVAFQLLATVNIHLFTHSYWLRYPYIDPVLGWCENTHIIWLYTVQYNGVNNLFVSISDISTRRTKIVKVIAVYRQ